MLGVVYAPLLQICYFSGEGCGAFKSLGQAPPLEIQARTQSLQCPVVVGSEQRVPSVDAYLDRLGRHEFKAIGSSLKLCKIAEGEADLYPCLATTYEWQTAAAHYIVEAAGGVVMDLCGEPLQYNAKASLVNPHFLVFGDKSRDWKAHAIGQQASKKKLMAA